MSEGEVAVSGWQALLEAFRGLAETAGPPGDLSPDEVRFAAAAVHRLSAGLSGSRGKAGAAYMDDARELAGYLTHWWPANFDITRIVLALAEIPSGRRALDLGAGPCPAALALRAHGFTEVVAVDHAPRALAVGAEIGRRAGHPVRTLVADATAWPLPLDGPFDVIWLGHTVNEWFKRDEDRLERRVATLTRLATLLAPGGRIVLVEPATHALNLELLTLRDALVAAGFPVLGPCTRQATCPAIAAGAACHADAAWRPPRFVEQVDRAAHLPRSSLPFTWFVFGAPGAGAPATGDLRVLTDVMLNKAGRERRIVCGEPGRVALSAPGRGPSAWRGLWQDLNKGDRVRVDGAEARENGLGLTDGTTLTRVARGPAAPASVPPGGRRRRG